MAATVQGERILVCDDDPQIQRALRLVLREAGYEVTVTGSGEEALDRAALIGPHAAIVDLMLPDSDGIEVCRRLRDWSEMPIIVLSALGEEAVKIKALESGADDYVTKPFGPASSSRACRRRCVAPGAGSPSRGSSSTGSSWISPRTPSGWTARRCG